MFLLHHNDPTTSAKFQLQLLSNLILAMFETLFGWRKASKCKKVIKKVQGRLKLLRSKRQSIARQLREDVAQLIKIGYQDVAFGRAEHLFTDENLVEIYGLLENFCEFIIVHLPYIRWHKDCPNDINEAVSTLLFASARCGDLPELRGVRKLFRERYGHGFERTAVELLPGNLVNLQVKQKLSITSIPDEEKQRLVDEISKDYCLRREILALEYTSETQQQAKLGRIGKPGNEDSNLSICNNKVEKTDTIPAPDEFEVVKESHIMTGCRDFKVITPERNKGERSSKASSSSESLLQFQDEVMVYLDDVEEFSSTTTDNEAIISSQDQRIFKFKSSSPLHRNENIQDRFDAKQSRRRCSSPKHVNVKDVECVVYYEKKPSKRPSVHSYAYELEHNEHQEIRVEQPYSIRCLNQEAAAECFLNHPCRHCHNCKSRETDSDTETECYIIHQKPRRRSSSSSSSCELSANNSDMKEKKAPNYERAMTMPQKRSKENQNDNVLRSSKSFPMQSPNHVHPKLPDYDNLTAQFMALKKQNLRTRKV